MASAISKAYNSIKELPSEVRSSFDERDQKKWMDAYNEASQNEEPEQAKVDAWMSMVDAPSSLAVETWGSVEVRDADGELVPVDTIANYADKFIENGGLMHDSHSNVPVGTVWNWDVRKHPETGQDGIVFYFNIYRDGEVFERARDDILSGRKQAVSIGAEAPRGGYKCDDRGCYVERDVTDLYELSICETPANPEAYFINVGKDIAKAKQPLEGEKMRFNVKDVIVHQDYTTCPLQKCKKDILDKGFEDVHLTTDGKIIAKSKTNEYELFKTVSALGYPFRYDIKKEQFEIMPDYGVEQAIEEALANDWAHEDNIGHVTLTRNIPKEVFLDWFDRGFIVKIGDNYCLKADDVAKGEIVKTKGKEISLREFRDMVKQDDDGSYEPWIAFTEELSRWTEYVMNKYSIPPEYNETVNNVLFTLCYPDAEEGFYPSDETIPIGKKVKKAGSFESYTNDAEILNSMEPDIEYTLEEIMEKNPTISEQEINYSLKRLNELPWKANQFNLYRISEGRYVKTDRYLASAKKKVKKDGGAMGVASAGASNPVYGSKPTSLVTPTGDKKYGKRRKAKKEMTDDRNIHGPTPTEKMRKSVNTIQKRCPNGYHKDENGNCVDANGNYAQAKQEQPTQEKPSADFDPSKLSEKEKQKIHSSLKSYRIKADNAQSSLFTALNIANPKNDEEYNKFAHEIERASPEKICDDYEKYVSWWNKINSKSKYDAKFKRGMNETKYSPLEYLKSIKQYVENGRKYSKLSNKILDYEQSRRGKASKSTSTWEMRKSANAIQKRCPNGYHKDEYGNCVDENGNYYQGQQEQPKQENPKNKKPKYDDEVMREYHEKYSNLEMIQYNDRNQIRYKAENCDKRLKEEYPKQYKEICRRFGQYHLEDSHQQYKLYKLITGKEDYREASGTDFKNIIENYDEIKKLLDSMKEEYKNTRIYSEVDSFEKLVTRYKNTYDERYKKLPKKMKELKEEQSKKMKEFKDKYGISDEEYEDWYWHHKKD